jgi:hypothetical protein
MLIFLSSKVAAMSVAQRVAEEMDVSLGQQAGYSIRSVRMRSATLGNEKCTYPWVRRLATQLGQYACALQH